MANKTYCFVNKKTYEKLKANGNKTFPIAKFLETTESKEKAIKQFASDMILEISDVKKIYHCFVYKPNKLHKLV